MLRDILHFARQVARNPGFMLIAVLSLALGIGATTAVFSVVYAALVNPFPYPTADRIVRLTVRVKGTDVDTVGLNGFQIKQLKQSPVVQGVLAMNYRALTLTGHEYPDNVRVTDLIATGFRDLGVPPLMGRGLLPSDAKEGQAPEAVAVLSYKFWQKHFLADPGVIGKNLELDHQKFLIVGVAAPRFTWYSPDVWLPLKLDSGPSDRFEVDVLLKPEVTQAAANAALQTLLDQFAKEYPKQFPKGFRVQVEGLNEWVVRNMGETLYLLLGAVLLLLAIGCGNVSILLLARGTARLHELSIRSAIGAKRTRLMQQLLTEALTLAIVGATLGILLSYGILAGIKTILPRYAFAPEVVVNINLPVLVFSVCVSLLTGVLFGLWPAFQLSGTELGQGMQLNVRRVAGSVMGRRTHQVLIAGQIALTLLLVTGAGAATEGFLKIVKASLGYEPHGVMSVPIPLRENSFTTWSARANYFSQLEKTVSQVPGVIQTAISSNATPPHSGWRFHMELAGKPTKDFLNVWLNLVSPNYFSLLHIPLLQGRLWNDTENINGEHVVAVNRALAQRYFPNGDVIGHAVKLPGIESRPPSTLVAPQIADSWLTIVGVVADSRDDGLRNAVQPAIYAPFTLNMEQFTQVLVRSTVPPLTLAETVRKQLARVNPDQQTFEIEDLDSMISESPEWQQEHLAAWIFGVFAILALVLAAVGLYSVVSFAVAQRTGEFGIRMALGAQAGDVLRAVFSSTLLSVSLGIASGLVLSFALGGMIAQWAGGDSENPVTIVFGALLLGVVAVVACAIPAHRATRIDPMTALRFE